MDIVTIAEFQKMLSKIDRKIGNEYLLVNGLKKTLLAKIKITEAPKEFEVITKKVYSK